MADNESNSGNSSNIDAAAQEQLLDDRSERSTSGRSTREQAKPASCWAKFTAEYLMRHCPYKVAFDAIDTSLWDVPVPEDADEAHATTWVAKLVLDYSGAMVWDDNLFDNYIRDFEG